MQEQYNVYVALTRAWDFLQISYPLADGEGKAKRPSQVVGQIKELFPKVKEEFKGMDLACTGDEALDSITSEKKAAALLSGSSREAAADSRSAGSGWMSMNGL